MWTLCDLEIYEFELRCMRVSNCGGNLYMLKRTRYRDVHRDEGGLNGRL